MKVKPEDLKLANKVAGVKESTSTTQKRNWWNGVHRLKTEGNKLILKTNDGSLWLEWAIPIEDESIELDVIVQERTFDYAARYLEGGSLDVTYANRIITLGKGQLAYRMREETPQTAYPEPEKGTDPVSWKMDSAILAKALRFVGPFVDETNPAANKSCATLYPEGLLIGGNPQRIVAVKGLKASEGDTIAKEMSFKVRAAKVAAEFLSSVDATVKITVTNKNYVFKDEESGHQLTICSEEGRFPKVERNMEGSVREIDQVDRKTLLIRAKAFAGSMPQGADKLNLSFKGEKEHASLRVQTPGEIDGEITRDEFAVYRDFPETCGDGRGRQESAEEKTNRVGQPANVGVNIEHLAEALDAMEGTNIKLKYCGYPQGRILVVEDEIVTGESEERGPEKLVLLTARQVRVRVQESVESGQQATAETPSESTQTITFRFPKFDA